tara:strand:+ start:101 stop:307 length:207 start_codon:yes stop_codon:yes gene_type:complete
MSNAKLMPAVSTAFDFTSSKVIENMVNFIRTENVEMTEGQMRKLASIVKGTFEQSLVLTSDSIQKAVS